MSEEKWKYTVSKNGRHQISEIGGSQVAMIWNCPKKEERGYLIAAAPEMYRFLDDLANGRGTDYPIEQLLAKARGEL